MTAKEVRESYPEPVKFIPGDGSPTGQYGCYCVLGAACMFSGGKEWWFRFPDGPLSAETLRIEVIEAERILDANDRGDFEAAWALLDQALSHRANGGSGE